MSPEPPAPSAPAPRLSVWLGRFPSAEDLGFYLGADEPEPGEAPFSPFGDDMGVGVVAPEVIEASFHGEPTTDIASVLAEHSPGEGFARLVASFWADVAGGPVNAVVLVWGDAVPAPRSVDGDDYELTFVASFTADDSPGTTPG